LPIRQKGTTARNNRPQHPFLLLPLHLRDWVTKDELVQFVFQAVQRLPLSAFAVNYRGCGHEQYPLQMMSALVIYCYANGILSSRPIEWATYPGHCAALPDRQHPSGS
jgi:transposase